MKSHTGTIVGAVVVIAIVIGVAYLVLNTNIGTQFNISSPPQAIPPSLTASTTSGIQIYGKNFNVLTQVKDSLDRTITYGDDTELNTICWDAHGSDDVSDWTDIGTFSEAEAGDANIDLDEATFNADGSTKTKGTTEMWCEFNLETSQDFAVDHIEIIRANDRIDSCIWVDANDDNDGTWACRYNLIGISTTPDPNQEPSDTIQVYLFDRETDETIIDSTTASAGSIAQGSQETEILFNIDFAASADVKMISDIRFRNNETTATDDEYSEESELCFDDDSQAEIVWFDTGQQVGCLELGDTSVFDRDNQASTIEYLWGSGNDYKDAILIKLPKNAGLQVDIPFKVHTEFSAATDATCWEIGFKYIDGFESKSAYDTVDFEVTADAVGDECTL